MKGKISEFLKYVSGLGKQRKIILALAILAAVALPVTVFAISRSAKPTAMSHSEAKNTEGVTKAQQTTDSNTPTDSNQSAASTQHNQTNRPTTSANQQPSKPKTDPCFTPQASPANCPAMVAEKAPGNYATPAPTPQVQPSCDIIVSKADIRQTSTGIHVPFRVVRNNGMTGPAEPGAVTITPAGQWPNIVMLRSSGMMTPDNGVFVLDNIGAYPKDLTVTFRAICNHSYEASTTVSFTIV